MKLIAITFSLFLFLISCDSEKPKILMKETKVGLELSQSEIDEIISSYPNLNQSDKKRLNKSIPQAASLWTEKDGSKDDFISFSKKNFKTEGELFTLFDKFQTNWEVLQGHFNKMNLLLKQPVALDMGELTDIDEMFDAYNPSAHLIDDLFNNKIAFKIILNFPNYSLDEKNQMGESWSRLDWAYARMGDLFTSRIPSDILIKASETSSAADVYIYNYYINMGNILDEKGVKNFPETMKLISHWNLRDEIKSNYSNGENGLQKQELIYSIMQRIINQEIPQDFINSQEYDWNPIANKLFKDGKEIKFESENNVRYQKILDQFKVFQEIDKYSPTLPTYIERKFSGEMELTIDEVEAMFVEFVSSPIAKKVANIIKQRLGRELKPFDIWYDGFKNRSTMNEDKLNEITKKRYPNPESFETELLDILIKLGFDKNKGKYIADKVGVDASRGAGHAWGAQMKGTKARLRTRINKDGMDYKGYNIAIHEFGHNVEQVLSLHDVDYYMLNGVPNTAFTEAMAFVFQSRDLNLLGLSGNDKDSYSNFVLDNFWSTYEIMGVSLVDQAVWKWLYSNPNSNAKQLKEATQKIAKDIWNKYYAPVFGVEDSNILAIYSHMISYPLYLSAYPIGHLIEFQFEKFIKDKNLAKEIERMVTIGRLTPNVWMKEAVGNKISAKALLEETDLIIKNSGLN